VTKAQVEARLQKAEVAETVSEGEKVRISITYHWVDPAGGPDEIEERPPIEWTMPAGAMTKTADARARRLVRW